MKKEKSIKKEILELITLFVAAMVIAFLPYGFENENIVSASQNKVIELGDTFDMELQIVEDDLYYEGYNITANNIRNSIPSGLYVQNVNYTDNNSVIVTFKPSNVGNYNITTTEGAVLLPLTVTK